MHSGLTATRPSRLHGSTDWPRGRAFRDRPRPQRGHAALPREPPLRPAPPRPRGAGQQRLPLPRGRRRPWPRRLKALGYRTAAFVSAFPLDSRFGLDAGFDVYDDRLGGAEIQASRLRGARAARGRKPWPLPSHWMGRAARRVRSSASSTSTSRTSPTSLRSPSPHGSRADPYQARSQPPTRPWSRSCARSWRPARTRARSWCLTADHGEGLGEHGELTHGIFAYEATLRVPLVLYAPRHPRPAAWCAARCATWTCCRPFSTPSALELPKELPGRSLLALAAAGERRGSAPATSRPCPRR